MQLDGWEASDYQDRLLAKDWVGRKIMHEATATSYIKAHPNAFASLVKKPKVKTKTYKPKPKETKVIPMKFMTDEEFWASDTYKRQVEKSTKNNKV